jgi:pyrroline-5-carboxylate reductase
MSAVPEPVQTEVSETSGRTPSQMEGTTDPSTMASSAETSNEETQKSSHKKKRSRSRKEINLETAKIGFVGAGKMAQSIVDGLLTHGNVKPEQIFVAAPSTKNLEYFKAKGIKTTKRLIEIFGRNDCDIIFFCMHGSVVKKAIRDGGKRPAPITTNYIPNMRHPIVFLSCVSGVSIEELKSVLLNPENPNKYKLEAHRIMANTAVSHGVGIVGIDCDPDSKKL